MIQPVPRRRMFPASGSRFPVRCFSGANLKEPLASRRSGAQAAKGRRRFRCRPLVRRLLAELLQHLAHHRDLLLLVADDGFGELANLGVLAMAENDLRHLDRTLMMRIIPRRKSTSASPE